MSVSFDRLGACTNLSKPPNTDTAQFERTRSRPVQCQIGAMASVEAPRKWTDELTKLNAPEQQLRAPSAWTDRPGCSHEYLLVACRPARFSGRQTSAPSIVSLLAESLNNLDLDLNWRNICTVMNTDHVAGGAFVGRCNRALAKAVHLGFI